MPKIELLSKEISELIAAGEVVERPASVVKELIENSIDAKAQHITVEISRGGISMIRITDDGCGINSSDVPLAFLRHATSKIKSADDLNAIGTLGFRGEALAATACVSRIEMFTKTKDEALGSHYVIEGANELLFEESGCPQGTTIIIRDIFYNTPARMKFLKKDATEGTTVQAVVERAALSHPEIAFKFIREGKLQFSTSGDGKLYTAIYSVLGREIATSLLEVNGTTDNILVEGFVSKPFLCRQSRATQYTFLNGRLVRSATVIAAVEQAYKNSTMVGKFPAFVLSIDMPLEAVDVNVHPAKTEVRFSDEKQVFSAVYYAVKSAIEKGDTRPEIAFKKPTDFGKMSAESYTQQPISVPKAPEKAVEKTENKKVNIFEAIEPQKFVLEDDKRPLYEREEVKKYIQETTENKEQISYNKSVMIEYEEPTPKAEPVKEPEAAKEVAEEKPQLEIKYIGEAFSTYIIVECENSVFLIDKHAAHERIIFNKLKEQGHSESQVLLEPVTVRLGDTEITALLENIEKLEALGFEIEDFGNGSVIVRAIPAMLRNEDAASIVTEAASSLTSGSQVNIERIDDIYHSVACKAAIKAGYITSKEEQLKLAHDTLSDDKVMYCPHGRPVAFEIKKKELERQFGRIQ